MNKLSKIFLILFFLISILLIGSVFAIFKSAQFVYGIDYENRLSQQILKESIMNAGLLEKEFDYLMDYSYEKEIITSSNSEIKGSFISESVKMKGLNKPIKRYYATDLLLTNKLVESDKLDMIRDKIIKHVPRKPYFIRYKVEIEKFESNIILPKKRNILIQNISHLLRKPAIAITYTNKEKMKQVTKVFLSDFLNGIIRVRPFGNVFITDFQGNLLVDSNGSKLILKENIKRKPIFTEVNKSLIPRMLRVVEHEDGKYYVASVKMEGLGIILFQTIRSDLLMTGIYRINEREKYICTIIIIFSEILLFIILKLAFRKKVID